MGFRFEVLVYAQIIGMLLVVNQYEKNVIFATDANTASVAIKNAKNFVEHNLSPQGALSVYFPLLAGIALFMTAWRSLVPQRTAIDLLLIFTIIPVGVWFWTDFLPLERSFATALENDSVKLLPKLIVGHYSLGIYVFTLLVLTLLASVTNYFHDPIELVFLNVLGGMAVIDLSFDLQIFLHASAPLEAHLAHVTHALGGALLEVIVPVLIGAMVFIILYRVVFQRSVVDALVLLVFTVGASIFGFWVLPVEKALGSQRKPNRDQQLVIAYSHVVLAALLLFITSLKLTIYSLTKTPNLHVVQTTPPVVPQEQKQEGKKRKQK